VNTRVPALVLFSVLVAASGCSKSETKGAAPAGGAAPAATATATTPGAPAGTTPAAPPAVKPVPAQLPEIVARVNGEAVKSSELDMAVKTLEERARSAVPPEQRDSVYRQVLDRVVGFHLLVQESRARKVVAPPWQVDQQIDEMRKQFPSEEAFAAALKGRGVTLAQLRADATDSLAVNVMLQSEVESKIAIQPAETKTFYDQNKARFRQEDSVHASHILIRADQNADAATKAKAKAQAADILRQLKGGAAFADLAKKFSQDPGSAPNGGDLGFFPKGQMVPQFDGAAFALNPGQTSAVIETPFGYHIIRVIETKPGRDLGYDEVKGQIEEYLKQQQREQKSQEFVDRLKAKGTVQILI
jgi:peptidyl-prolyl cis-trans isomerase C